jgi:uncharacterized membrane protein YbaN (DUF454 family)
MYLLIAAGTAATATGIIGIFVPVLPTTPFLLLAAACYMRSSERCYRWLTRNRAFGAYVRNYIEGKGMALNVKLGTLFLLWGGIGVTMGLGTENLAVRIVLGLVAVGVTIHIIKIKTMKKTRPLNPVNEMTTDAVFDEIAPGWYNYRHRSIFTRNWKRWRDGGGRTLLNVGCGTPDIVPIPGWHQLHASISPADAVAGREVRRKIRPTVNLRGRALPCPTRTGFRLHYRRRDYHHIDAKGHTGLPCLQRAPPGCRGLQGSGTSGT